MRGKKLVEWSGREMPVIKSILKRFTEEQPLKNIRIAACLHVTTETANLMMTLKAGGADVRLCASNPLSTNDDVVEYLNSVGIPTYAKRGCDNIQYYRDLEDALNVHPNITMDDGADLVTLIHQKHQDMIKDVIGGTEETTTGVTRLKNMAKAGKLQYGIIAVNEALTKHLFDNRYGTGQSTVDGVIRATNVLLAGKNVVVCGYGWCGRGFANRVRGLGAHVTVTEIDATKALEATMDGFKVAPLQDVIGDADIVVTLTGCCDVVSASDFLSAKNGAIFANSGHFNVELDVAYLEATGSWANVRPNLDAVTLVNGKTIYLIGMGRLVNLTAAEGHPSSVMDMSFANQALCIEHIVKNGLELYEVYDTPDHIDNEVAKLKLASMNIDIDRLTQKQIDYNNAWSVGT